MFESMIEEVYKGIRKTLCKNTAFYLFCIRLYEMVGGGGRPANLVYCYFIVTDLVILINPNSLRSLLVYHH